MFGCVPAAQANSVSKDDVQPKIEHIEKIFKTHKAASPLDLGEIIEQWQRPIELDWWRKYPSVSPELLCRNVQVGGAVDDQSFWYNPHLEQRYGGELDLTGPSVLFQNEAFQMSLRKLLADKNRPFPNLLACVTFHSIFNDHDVSIAYLCSMMIQMLQSYQHHANVTVYSLFLYGFTVDEDTKTCIPSMPDFKQKLTDRFVSIKRHRQLHATDCPLRLVFLCGVNNINPGHGHWILVAFDFEDESMQTAKAFCFPEWEINYQPFDSLVDFIAETGGFTISKKKTIWISSQGHLDEFRALHPGDDMEAIEIACGYSMLRHLMVCSTASTAELSDGRFEAQLRTFDKDYFPQFLVFFARLWNDLLKEKKRVEAKTVSSIKRWLGNGQGNKIRLQFLLVSGAYMSPCLDFSDDAVPFEILTVEFNGSEKAKAVGLLPRYYCNFEWSDTRDAPKPGESCNLQSEANMLLDMMGELHRRLSFIERNA